MRQSTGLALGYDTPVLTAYVPASATELTFFARHRGWWEFAFYGDSSGRSSECRVQGRPFTSQRLIPYIILDLSIFLKNMCIQFATISFGLKKIEMLKGRPKP